MIIKYSYRGVETILSEDMDRPKISIKGAVSFESRLWTDGNEKYYTVEIEAHELLTTAQRCIAQLNSIAGTSYVIVNRVK